MRQSASFELERECTETDAATRDEVFAQSLANSEATKRVCDQTWIGGINKETRIMELDGSIRNRDFVFVKDKGTEILVNQLKAFPHGNHDDGPDALQMATKMLRMIAE